MEKLFVGKQDGISPHQTAMQLVAGNLKYKSFIDNIAVIVFSSMHPMNN